MKEEDIRFEAVKGVPVTGLWLRPEKAQWTLVLAHGAGAGMRHPFMERVTHKLANHGMAIFRYQFPYMERREKRPDPPSVLQATVRAAVAAARDAGRDLPLLAGGKSMGGRMTSMAAAQRALADIRGVVFFGFPLHPPGTPAIERSQHLFQVTVPMLFLQGTRDKLADLNLLRPICDRLGRNAKLHVIDGADHSFHVLKSTGRTDDEVIEELASTVAAWSKMLSLNSKFA